MWESCACWARPGTVLQWAARWLFGSGKYAPFSSDFGWLDVAVAILLGSQAPMGVSYAPGEWPTNGPVVCHGDCGCGQTPASASLSLCIRPASPSAELSSLLVKKKGSRSLGRPQARGTPHSKIMTFMATAKLHGHDDTHTHTHTHHAESITTVNVHRK